MPNKRSYNITSTTVLTAVSDYDTVSTNDRVSVENNSDGDVELYWGQTMQADVYSCQNTFRAYDGFHTKGQMYIKNVTGTGGEVVVHVWRDSRA